MPVSVKCQSGQRFLVANGAPRNDTELTYWKELHIAFLRSLKTCSNGLAWGCPILRFRQQDQNCAWTLTASMIDSAGRIEDNRAIWNEFACLEHLCYT
jgi:hypothetical protein